jgi:hypothetical protein
MKTVFEDPQFLVVDDFLPDEQFRALWSFLQTEEYRFVHVPDVRGVWRVTDGLPMTGSSSAAFCAPPAEVLPPETPVEELPFFLHPRGKPIDVVTDAIEAMGTQIEPWAGRRGHDWAALTSTPYIYPQGTGLGWHDDGGNYSGAFAYYAHPSWSASWGGELLIARDDNRVPRVEERQKWAASHQNAALLEVGLGRFVMPKPNRLVVLRGHTFHTIARVSPAAGDNVRAIVGGFFVLPESVPKLIRGEIV